ncbi:MAG TPA: hypothetical protein VKX96_11545 [Chloroflexota bacterium]|nr:hypothetical protein [Chloroflexota bacterium]
MNKRIDSAVNPLWQGDIFVVRCLTKRGVAVRRNLARMKEFNIG